MLTHFLRPVLGPNATPCTHAPGCMTVANHRQRKLGGAGLRNVETARLRVRHTRGCTLGLPSLLCKHRKVSWLFCIKTLSSSIYRKVIQLPADITGGLQCARHSPGPLNNNPRGRRYYHAHYTEKGTEARKA